MSKTKIETLADLTPLATNPNPHTPEGMKELENSIGMNGFTEPMVAAANLRVLSGNARLEKAFTAMPDNPIVVESDGTRAIVVIRTDIENEDTPIAKRIILASNRVQQINYEPDNAIIADILAALENEPGGTNGTGFTDRDVEEILQAAGLGDVPDDPGADVDRAEELREKWQTELGQVWEIESKTAQGVHRVICGDCTDRAVVERVMMGEKADLILTDPPYGINVVSLSAAAIGGGKPVTIGSIRGRRKDTFGGVKSMGSVDASHWVDANLYAPVIGDDKPFDPAHILEHDCDMIIFGGNYFASKLPDSRCWIVWDKNNTGNFADAELAWTSFETGVKLYKFTWNGLVREGEREEELIKRVHPTQKPVGLFKMILTDFSEEKNQVLDLYLGSGTTLVACERLARLGRGIELSPAYVAVALERLAGLGLTPRLVE